ncbi:hypothetical protein Barb6_02501 [Bacteroidales bacterium Barb6]|nr:hypothetical protein Barb6_02501 [Bacteroidales bacterium Barb6]
MKRLLLTSVLFCSFLSLRAADITQITNAFKEGNVSSVAKIMAKEADVVVPGSAKKYSGSEAVAKLDAFFKTHKPTGFQVVHHADKKDNGFFTGEISAADGRFRVNVIYRIEDGKAVIQSIKIE